MIRFGVELQFITPFHIGFDKSGKLPRTTEEEVVIPQIVLSTQLAFEASRFSPFPIPPPRVSPGFFSEARFYSVKARAIRKEFVKGSALFTLTCDEARLPYLLAGLASRSFAGWGGETSHGFGAARAMIRLSSMPFDDLPALNSQAKRITKPGEFPFPSKEVRFPQHVWESLKRRWKAWLRCVAWFGAFERRFIYFGREFVLRGLLRRKLNEAFGEPHKDEILVCPPTGQPCPVCQIMGSLGRKSGVVSRKVKGGQILVVEAIPAELLPEFEEVVTNLGFEKQREETREFYLGRE